MTNATTDPKAPATFEISLPGAIDIHASVERFRTWGDDLLDRWNGQTFARVAVIAGAAVPYACTPVGSIAAPRVRVLINNQLYAPEVEAVVRGMFGAAAPEHLERLAKIDPVIGRLHARYPGIRPIIHADGFTALIRSISAQQVNLTWAATTRRRLAESFGQRYEVGDFSVYHLAPSALAMASVASLRQLQLTTRKSEYIIDLARQVEDGTLNLAELGACDDEEVVRRIRAVRGLGRWTAEWYLARTLGRPRVAAGDLAVRKAVGRAYHAGPLLAEDRVRELTAHWGEAAALAQELMLYALGQGAWDD